MIFVGLAKGKDKIIVQMRIKPISHSMVLKQWGKTNISILSK